MVRVMRQCNALPFLSFIIIKFKQALGKSHFYFKIQKINNSSIQLVLEGKFTQNRFMIKMPKADAFVQSVALKGPCNLNFTLKTYGHYVKQRQWGSL